MKPPAGHCAEAAFATPQPVAGSLDLGHPCVQRPVELDRLQDICCGDKEFERELIEVFLSDTRERIRKMEAALHEKNLEIFYVQAHSIKGASANAGAETMTSLAMALEKSMPDGNGNDPELLRMMNELKQEYEKVRAFLTDYMDNDLPHMEDIA